MRDIDAISGDVLDLSLRVHREKQLLTYLRLLHQPVGLIINFGGETLKEGVKQVVNDYSASSAPPRLCVNKPFGG